MKTTGCLLTLVAIALLAASRTAEAVWLNLDESTAVASSLEQSFYSAANAFDDDNTTRWSSAHSDDHWIYVDLGQEYWVTAVEIDWETAHSEDYTLRVRSALEGPDSDPANWTEVANIVGRAGVAGGSGATDDIFDFSSGSFTADTGSFASASVDTGVFGRYLMMHATDRATGWGNSIFELDVNADVPEPATLLVWSLLAGLAVALGWRRR